MTPAQKQARILAKLEELTGVKIEPPPVAVETEEDRMREAQSVINFFTVNDGKWALKICATCELSFVYRYHINGIKYCSVPCAREALQKLGLDWDPTRETSQRWGRYVPAVVPPAVLYKIQQLLGATPVDPLDNIDPELLR